VNRIKAISRMVNRDLGVLVFHRNMEKKTAGKPEDFPAAIRNQEAGASSLTKGARSFFLRNTFWMASSDIRCW